MDFKELTKKMMDNKNSFYTRELKKEKEKMSKRQQNEDGQQINVGD